MIVDVDADVRCHTSSPPQPSDQGSAGPDGLWAQARATQKPNPGALWAAVFESLLPLMKLRHQRAPRPLDAIAHNAICVWVASRRMQGETAPVNPSWVCLVLSKY